MTANSLIERLRATRATLPHLVALSAAQRDQTVMAMATALRAGSARIDAANAEDLEEAQSAGQTAALLDRLRLDRPRIAALADALDAIAELPDPLADTETPAMRADGLRIRRKPAPLGVIAMVFEARPNVTAEAAALCFKAGNACVLRGGREARQSNLAIASVLRAALTQQGVPADALCVLDDPDRSELALLLQQDELVDLVIPRGGEALIRHVAANSRIPVIRHYKGVCHLFVDASADFDQAERLLIDGKTSRPAVCNALECLLVHADAAAGFLPRAAASMRDRSVQLRGCERTQRLLPEIAVADDGDWGREYLDLTLAVRVVDDLDAALAHIRRFGSNHTEVICTRSEANASRFVNEADASAVMVNASSRFNDGGQLGLGAEIGISTSKLHAYGPMGLASLTCRKWVVEGDGQVRHPMVQG